MRNGRIRFWRTVKKAGGDRVRLMYPHVDDGKDGDRHHDPFQGHGDRRPVSAHRLGQYQQPLDGRRQRMRSRDRGAATPSERRAIVDIRNRLIGEHCGVTADELARALKQARNSLLAVADRLSANGHSLRPIDDGEPDERAVGGHHRATGRPESSRSGFPTSAAGCWAGAVAASAACCGRSRWRCCSSPL